MKKPLSTILLVCVSLIAGGLTGKLIMQLQSAAASNERITEERARAAMEQMENFTNFHVGDTLSNGTLEYLSGAQVALSDLTHDWNLILIINPKCGSCEFELEHLSTLLSNEQQRRVIVVSEGNPRHLQDMRDSTGFKGVFLYDHRGKWLSQYEVRAFPFYIGVDSSLVLRSVYGGGILDEEVRQFANNMGQFHHEGVN